MKSARIPALIAALCVLLGLCAGCREAAPSFLGFDLSQTPRTLDPQTADDAASQFVIRNLFEGLLEREPDGTLSPAAAARYSVSEDQLTYTFVLREDIWWSYAAEDGTPTQEPVTAADFVFAFRRLFQSNTNPTAASRYFCIQNARAVLEGEAEADSLGVTALSDRELRFVLEAPNDNFPDLLTATYAMPCNESFFRGTRGRYGMEAETILSNGPFRILRWTSDSIRLEKNDTFRLADTMLPEEVRLYAPNDSAGDSVQRLSEGLVHAAFLSGQEGSALQQGFQSEPIETTVWGLLPNWDNALLANEQIRSALALAFDRSSYEGLLTGELAAARAILPHGILLSGTAFRDLAGEELVPAYDPQAAYTLYKKGLSALGRTGAGELRLIVNADSGTAAAGLFTQISQVLQRDLSLFINVEYLDANTYGSRLATGDFELALCELRSPDSSPWSILSRFLEDSPENYGGYSNPDFDAALHAAESASRAEESDQAYLEAERLLLEDTAFYPLAYSTDYFVTRSDVHDIVYNPWNGFVDFRFAYME